MGETLTLTLETADEDGDFTATVTIDLHHRGSYNEPVPGGYISPEFDVTLVKFNDHTIDEIPELDAFKREYNLELFDLIDTALDTDAGEDR
tara:strand:+ start:5763 stop:6035 length:273 start_codon:yes stop_codon:yes gene_type:complete